MLDYIFRIEDLKDLMPALLQQFPHKNALNKSYHAEWWSRWITLKSDTSTQLCELLGRKTTNKSKMKYVQLSHTNEAIVALLHKHVIGLSVSSIPMQSKPRTLEALSAMPLLAILEIRLEGTLTAWVFDVTQLPLIIQRKQREKAFKTIFKAFEKHEPPAIALHYSQTAETADNWLPNVSTEEELNDIAPYPEALIFMQLSVTHVFQPNFHTFKNLQALSLKTDNISRYTMASISTLSLRMLSITGNSKKGPTLIDLTPLTTISQLPKTIRCLRLHIPIAQLGTGGSIYRALSEHLARLEELGFYHPGTHQDETPNFHLDTTGLELLAPTVS